MTGLIKTEVLTQFWKKYRLVLLIMLAGLILMILPSGNETAKEVAAAGEELYSLKQTQQNMEAILSHIDGVGRLELMLTLKNSSQLQLAEDKDRAASGNEVEVHQEMVTINRGSGYEEVVITQRIYPAYQGALVVCQGADNAAVRLAVIEAVAALTGLSSDRISVVKWKS